MPTNVSANSDLVVDSNATFLGKLVAKGAERRVVFQGTCEQNSNCAGVVVKTVAPLKCWYKSKMENCRYASGMCSTWFTRGECFNRSP